MRVLYGVLAALLLSLSASAAAGSTSSLEQSLRALSGETGIWYFYLSTCPYCAMEEPVLQALSKRYHLRVVPISLDGGPPPAPAFRRYQIDRGQARQLGVTVTPTLYLVHPATRQAVQLTAGYMPADRLKRRLVFVATQAGWIDAAQATASAPRRRRAQPGDASVDSILHAINAHRRQWP